MRPSLDALTVDVSTTLHRLLVLCDEQSIYLKNKLEERGYLEAPELKQAMDIVKLMQEQIKLNHVYGSNTPDAVKYRIDDLQNVLKLARRG